MPAIARTTVVTIVAVLVWAGGAAASPHRTGLSDSVVAADHGRAVIAGSRGGKIRLARLDRYGRPGRLRVLGGGDGSYAAEVALAGDHVAVAWLQGETLVLVRTDLHGGPITVDRLPGHNINIHTLAVNQEGVVLDVFKDQPDFDPTGVSGFLAAPGARARLIEIAPITNDNRNGMQVGTDAAGGFHVSWQSDPGYDLDHELLGHADADASGTFGPSAEERPGGSLSNPDVATGADGSQVAAYYDRGHVKTTRRVPGGPWQPAVIRQNVANGSPVVRVAIDSDGDALVASAPLEGENGPRVIRATVLRPDGAARAVSLRRGVLADVVADDHGRAQVVTSSYRPWVTKVATVPLARIGKVRWRNVARSCSPDSDYDAPEHLVDGDADGRLTMSLFCSSRAVASAVRVPAP